MKNLVAFTGAGMSAESGIRTFRDAKGLWEEHDVMEVASIEGWHANRELVMRFYNERRKQLLECEPNEGHRELVRLEQHFNVQIVTQNVDDLHERAGSKNILHLHGELRKARSSSDPRLVYDIDGWELKFGDKCEKGSQLRPHIVWFGEAVPAMEDAIKIVEKADIFVVIGSSLVVYPAASLLQYVPRKVPVYVIDPNDVSTMGKVTFIKEPATTGLKKLSSILLQQ
jgi:NAD-dependent deacetylase